MSKRAGWLLAVAILGGCQSLPTGSRLAQVAAVDPAVAATAQQARARALGLAEGDCLRPGWAMAGRIAIAAGKDAGSGRFEWTQGEGRLQLQLIAPVTVQTWILHVDPQGARLDGLAGGPRAGAEPARLLREATGWDIPVQALGCWTRAVAASEAGLGAASIRFDAQSLPQRIEQGGWEIEYSRWQPDPFSGLPMPSRIDARHGDSRVRLAVDRWGLE